MTDNTTKKMDKATQNFFDTNFLPAAEAKLDEASQAQLEKDLAEKQGKIKNPQLQKVIDDAKLIWDKRTDLSRSDLVILIGGFLYLISPLDIIPDVIPIAGYLDDLAVLTAIVTVLKKTLTFAIEETKAEAEILVDKSIAQARQEAEDYREETITKVDEMIDRSFDRTLSAVVLGLWGTTTAVALTLLVTSLTGRIAYEFYFYTITAGTLVLMLNFAALIDTVIFYRKLDEEWQRRLMKAIIGKVSFKRTLTLLTPIAVFVGLSIVTFMLNMAKDF